MEPLRIGIAGIGFMGMVHYLSYTKLRGVKVAAVCDPDAKKRGGDWRGIKGNFGPPGEVMDLSEVATYETLDELVADESIDAIDICLPPSLHADATCQALVAGKHVFCEKPMAMRVDDCDRMIRAAENAGRLLMIGHVLPYFPEYAWVLDEVRGGKHGALLGGSFKRVIADPSWISTFWDADLVGGPMLDLHVHDAHFIRMLFGQPHSVATSGRMRDGLPEYWTTQFEFSSSQSSVEGKQAVSSERAIGDRASLAVTATSGTIRQQGRSFQHACEIHLEQATLVFDFAVLGCRSEYLCPPTVLTACGDTMPADLTGGDPMNAFQAELREVVHCLRANTQSVTLGAEFARDAIRLCHAQARSLRTGRRVSIELDET